MKTILSCAVLLLIIQNNFCQIKVRSDGNVGIATSDPAAKFCVGTDGASYSKSFIYNSSITDLSRTLQVNQKTENMSAGQQLFGIVSYVDYGGATGSKVYGIFSSAYRGSTPNLAYTLGVYATAGNGYNGRNYGVFGHIQGTRNGAGIVGTNTAVGDMPTIDRIYAGYFKGKMKVTDTLFYYELSKLPSDRELKKDIRNLDQNYISKILQLQGVKYKLRHPSEISGYQSGESDTANTDLPNEDINSVRYTSDHLGFIAQDVQKIYPELVCEHPNGKLGLNTIDLIPILVEAIKEQQLLIEDIQLRLNELESDSGNLKSETVTKNGDLNLESNSSYLFQNDPNPFNIDTKIRYRIPKEASDAAIYLYDLQGKQILSFAITDRDLSYVIINGYDLNPGIYLYALIVNGREIDTKSMILTK